MPKISVSEEWKRKKVIDLFAQHKISIGRAAELLDVSIADMLGIAKEHNIDFVGYEKGDLKRELKILDEIAAKSKLTEEDAIELGRKINKSMHERLKKEHPEYFKDLSE